MCVSIDLKGDGTEEAVTISFDGYDFEVVNGAEEGGKVVHLVVMNVTCDAVIFG